MLLYTYRTDKYTQKKTKIMSNFITNNEQKDLKKRIIELCKKSDVLKFLVGFFYFSGIKELYNGLKANPDVLLKVLVGLKVDKINFNLIEIAETTNITDEEKIYTFFESIKNSINTEVFDNKEFYEQVKFFINLIQSDKLIIRKTYKPNHSKLYIFKLEEEQVARNKLFITGSSNLTKAGLSEQNEFNVEISDYGVDEAEKYFDVLWDDAIKITERDEIRKHLIELLKNKTLVKEVTPFEAYALILKNYLESYEQKNISDMIIELLQRNNYYPYKYQIDAIKQALAIIENHNGVIIADVVGLGKTVIASAAARELKKRGIVICPPGIIGDTTKNSGWRRYLEEFGLASMGWEVFSIGELEKVLDFVQNRAKDIEVVIVDEAHRFRNQDTESYELLKNICRGKKVILLTATPFNNRPSDIFSLIKLFDIPKKSGVILDNNLVDKFRTFKGIFYRLGYIKKYWNSPNEKKRLRTLNFYQSLFEDDKINLEKVTKRTEYLAQQIRNVIEPVTIRRNRLDLQRNPFYKDEVQNLSKVADPIEWFFELTKEQSEFYDEIIKEYFGDPDYGGKFKGAIYRPFEYETGIKDEFKKEENREYIQQRNLFDFMRRLMVKRFESSFGAFQQSVKNFKKITEDVLTFIKKTDEYILDRNLLEKIYDKDIDEIEQYLLEYEEKIKNGEYPKNHKRYKLKEFKLRQEFLDDIKSDIKMFNEILSRLEKLSLIENDPKVKTLIEKLQKELSKKPLKDEPKRKIVIFSEYIDTIKYLAKILKNVFGNRTLVVAGNITSSIIRKINENFDASYYDQKDDYDILLATDKISEGINLNRAGMVINYDIPWNPVRVIQRVGRINRISKKVFDELYIVNFFPTEKGAELVKSREIAQNKMYIIHNTLGEDAKIFDIDEEPTPAKLYQRIQQNPDKQEVESFYTKVLNDFLKIKRENPELIAKLNEFPPRIKVAKKFTENELLVFYKKRRLYVIGYNYDDGKDAKPYSITFEEIYEKIKCNKDENPLNWNTDKFWDAYEKIKKFKETRNIPSPEQSNEQKALNILNYFITNNNDERLLPYKKFLRTLREDILDYGTLPDYTLRRIANLEAAENKLEKAIKEIKDIMNKLGEDYLEKEKRHLRDYQKEIIIAVNNVKTEL